jgi:MFS family permease
MSDSSALKLLTERRFGPLVVSQSLGAFNDNVFKYSLIIMITFGGLHLQGIPRDVLVPVAATVFSLPFFLFSAIAGQVADRFARDRVLRYTKFGEIILMSGAAAGFILNSGPILFVVLFFMGAQSAIFAPAKQAALPHYLSRKELVPGNALISGTLFLSILSGSLVGILLIRRAEGPLIIGTMLVILAVLGWVFMRMMPTKPAAAPDLKLNWNIFSGTWHTMANLFTEPKALRPLIGVAWFWTAGAASTTILPLFVHDTLYMDVSVVSIFMAVFTIGAALGSLGCAIATKNRDVLWLSIAGAVLLSLFSVDIYLSSLGRTEAPLGGISDFFADKRNWRLLFDFFAMAIFSGVFVVPLQAMSQHRAPELSRARVLAGGAVMNAAGASMGQMALIGITRTHLPLSSAYIGIALVSLLFALFMIYRRMKNTW